MKKKNDTIITWALFNNIVPIITSAILLTLSWSSLNNQIALLNQKLDYVIQQQKELVESRRGIENRYGEIALQVKELQTLVGIKK